MTTRYAIDPINGQRIYYEVNDAPLTKEQLSDVGKIILSRVGERLDAMEQEVDQRHTEGLQARRERRLTTEALESFTEAELRDFANIHGRGATARRLAELAKLESDHLYERAETERMDKDLQEWQKDFSLPQTGDSRNKKLFELAEAGAQRANQRNENRHKRELEAEIHQDEYDRVFNGLDLEEQAIFTRLLNAEPTILDKVEQFKAERCNPIENIDDPNVLYRMANQKPRPEKYVPPTSAIEDISDSKTLYAMAQRDAIAKTKKR